MPVNTPRLGLVTPAGTDNESLFPSQATTTYGVLDESVLMTSGTLASRPATPTPNVSGVTYYATDVKRFYFYDGAAWNTVQVAGAWSNLTLQTGITAFSGHYTPAARIVGDKVELCGVVINSTGASSPGLFATLPSSAYYPASTVIINANNFDGTNEQANCIVINSGTANLIAGGGPSQWPTSQPLILDGLSYRLV